MLYNINIIYMKIEFHFLLYKLIDLFMIIIIFFILSLYFKY